ncbi:MAG: carbohydrate ABC transporter permease [Elusimicrobiota bacterium]
MATVTAKGAVASIKNTAIYLMMFAGAVFVMFPFFWMIIVALKPDGQAFKLNLIFQNPFWKNFADVLKNESYPFWMFFLNSVIVSTCGAALTTLICALAGYAFAKKNFILKETIFWALLATMMIPGMMYLVPQFALVTEFKWINTYQGMIVPHLANVFGVFLMRQYMETIPSSLLESARIDGASEIKIFTRIVLPLSVTIVTMLFLLSFLFHWSNFLWHLVVNTPESNKLTLPVGLALYKGQYEVFWSKLMAASCFSIVPIAILFTLAQRFFIEGLTAGAVKE